MTDPVPLTPGMQLALDHAQLATSLAAPIDEDRYVTADMVPVVRAYRALSHALLATWAMAAPDAVASSGGLSPKPPTDPTPVSQDGGPP
jgi:hypothetical protein